MLEFAKVCGVHNGANAVDLLMLRNGQAIPMVQCMCDLSGTDFGESGLVAPTVTDPNNEYDPQASGNRDIIACVGFVGKRPIVLGFVYPQVCQMLFDESVFSARIKRDPSDVYCYTDDNGNFEFYHPSGTYLRIATDTTHKDLTGLDLDGKWKISKNTSAAVHVHLEVHNGGATKATVDIDPSGNITSTNAGNLTATVNGSGGATITTPNGQINLNGVTIDKNGNINGPGTVTAAGEGTFNGGHTVSHHTHGGVQTGGGTTGLPTG